MKVSAPAPHSPKADAPVGLNVLNVWMGRKLFLAWSQISPVVQAAGLTETSPGGPLDASVSYRGSRCVPRRSAQPSEKPGGLW